MERGGYESVDPKEALRQSDLSERQLAYHYAFGIPGSVDEAFRLTLILAAMTAMVSVVAAAGVLTLLALPIAVGSAVVAAIVAPPVASRLVRPIRPGVSRGLLWGLLCAALFLLGTRIVLALALLGWLRIHGVGPEAAGVQAFHGAASFTLMLAMPTWAILAAWGFMRRRGGMFTTAAPSWRRMVVPAIIVAVMIFMGAEGAYMDSLKR